MKAKKPAPGLTEAQVTQGVVDAFRMFGIDAARRNTGGFANPAGQYVQFGTPGDSDWTATTPASWGGNGGKTLDVEVKREDFDPGKLRGEKRDHFDRQLDRLIKTCENGGFGLWITDARQLVHALQRIKDGWRVEFEGDYPVLTDEPRGGDDE